MKKIITIAISIAMLSACKKSEIENVKPIIPTTTGVKTLDKLQSSANPDAVTPAGSGNSNPYVDPY